jgi:cell division protein FtsW
MPVVTALVPTTGIPHPLVSYGGSSLVVSIVALGIIVSLSRADQQRDACVLE